MIKDVRWSSRNVSFILVRF